MSVVVNAPPLSAPRVSLISSALVGVPPAGSGERWYGSLLIAKTSAEDATGLFPICPTDEETKDAQNRLGTDDFFPFVVYATDACSTFTDVKYESAKNKLDVAESWWLEREFWEGSLNLGNTSLIGADSTILGTALDVKEGFSRLDAAIAVSGHDGRGMIHVSPHTFDKLQGYDLVRREGNVWLSPLDNYVVPGHGYTGNGPNPGGGANENDATATVHWMFAHPGMIVVYRGPLILNPPELEDGPNKEAIDRQINDIVVYAERAIGYVLSNVVADDSETSFYAVSVDLTTGDACCAGAEGGGGGLTDAQLRATPVDVEVTNTVTIDDGDIITAIDAVTTAVGAVNAAPTITRVRGDADSGGGGIATNVLHGWFLEETAGAVAVVRIRFGNDNADTPFIPVHFAANESVSFWSERGIATGGNIFFDEVSGSVDGTFAHT